MRDKARKDYNYLVSALALYVKKRDPRYILRLQVIKERQEEIKRIEDEKRLENVRIKMEKCKEFVVADWTRADYLEEGTGKKKGRAAPER